MPVKNPSPELIERIREHGLCKETGARAQWGYHRKADPRIFLLDEAEKLPEGWAETPHADNQPRGDAG